MESRIYSIFHGVGGDDVRIVSGGVSREAVGEEAYPDVPFDKMVRAVSVFPEPPNSYSFLAVALL